MITADIVKTTTKVMYFSYLEHLALAASHRAKAVKVKDKEGPLGSDYEEEDEVNDSAKSDPGESGNVIPTKVVIAANNQRS